MTTYTTQQLATRVMKDLNWIAAGETPSSDDLNWAVETCESEILMMAARGIPIWNGSEISIPQEYLTALSRRIGLALAPSIGLMDLASATQAIELAEINLLRLAQIGPTGAVMQGEYI